MTIESIKAHCNNCGPDRNHEVLFRKKTTWEIEDVGLNGGDNYSMIRCQGCDNVHLKHDAWNSEDYGPAGPDYRTNYYPPAVFRREPQWLSDLTIDHSAIETLLAEIYSALQNDSRRLAVMGIRALLEYIMIEQVGDTGSIGGNITTFIKAGHVAPKAEAIFRDHLIESGHAAMHRNYNPSPSDLLTLLELTESIIEQVYIHPERAKLIKIPARKKS